MKCEVDFFKRGIDLTIGNLINHITTNFKIGLVNLKMFVNFILIGIVLKCKNKINKYKSFDYFECQIY